jgi:hypothetical protein
MYASFSGNRSALRYAAPVLTMRREITLFTSGLTMKNRGETVLPKTCDALIIAPKNMADPVEVVGLNDQLNRSGRQISWSFKAAV